MALTIDSIVRHGISTKLGHECLLNKTKVMLYYPYILQEEAFLHHQQDAALLSYKVSGYTHSEGFERRLGFWHDSKNFRLI